MHQEGSNGERWEHPATLQERRHVVLTTQGVSRLTEKRCGRTPNEVAGEEDLDNTEKHMLSGRCGEREKMSLEYEILLIRPRTKRREKETAS